VIGDIGEVEPVDPFPGGGIEQLGNSEVSHGLAH
jgi:hypothetical protein